MRQAEAQQVRQTEKVAGRWYFTHGANPEVVAKCGVCGRVVAAVALELRRLPWGRGEVWACRGGHCS
jgi:hypothetical protein